MKKLLSMLLAVVFIFSCVTFTVSAEESESLTTPIKVTGITGTTKELSPSFLNKWRGGGDMGEQITQVGMLRSRQFVGATETLRFMPNKEMPSSPMSSDGYSDGYDIPGITLNGDGYKYIVIPYYYTAPELAVGADTGRYYAIELASAPAAYKLHKSRHTMKANQWDVAIIDINSNIAANTSLSRLYQYPYGATQSGNTITAVVASTVPESHTIDITKLIFCKEEPGNITVTGNTPGRDFYFIASDINDTYVTNHTPNEIIPGNILAGHNAFANTNTAQFVSNGDTTRSNGVRWYVSRAHNIPSEIQKGASVWSGGVDITDYNYISIYYYYTVPEGEEPNGSAVSMSVMCREPGYLSSGDMASEGSRIANTWAVVTFDISKLLSNSAAIKSAASEFMFRPYGVDGNAKNVPETHSFDIARIVFSKDKPSIMNGALDTYSNGLVPAASVGEVPECQISENDLLNPGNENLDGLAAKKVSTDGYNYVSVSKDTGDNSVKYWLSHNNDKNERHSPLHKKYIKVDYFYYKGDAQTGADSGAKMQLSTAFYDEKKNETESRIVKLPSTANIVYNQWSTAVFNISSPGSYATSTYKAGSFNNINLYPFGAVASVGATDKVYIANISFCETLPTVLSADYIALKHTNEGEFVPTIENIEYNPQYFKENAADVNVENAALTVESFIVGEAAKVTPVEGDYVPEVVIPFTEEDYNKLKYRPYVRLEYFMNINEDDFVQGMKPAIKIMTEENPTGYICEFDTTLVHGWNAVNLDLSQEDFINETIAGVVLYPYGTDALRYKAYIFEHNKIYLNNFIFSQEEITGDLGHPIPEMNADGEFLPYKYVPSDGRPVVYYARGGVYTGAAAGSTDQSKAYATLAEAVTAINSIGGGYVIMCTDVGLNTNNVALDGVGLPGEVIPSHTNMVILRGMEKPAEETKTTIWLSGSRNLTNGPLEIQNLNLANYADGTTTTELRCSGYTFNYGTPGAGYDDITYNVGGETGSIEIIAGGDGGSYAGANINFNSGSFKGYVHSGGLFGGSTFTDDINVTFYGTDMTGAFIRFGYATQITVSGDVNFTFNGGKFDKAFIGSSAMTQYPIKVSGKYTIKITGGDFSAVPDGSIKSLYATSSARESSLEASEKILDIENYSGVDTDGDGYVDFDVIDLLAKIDQSTFTTVKANIVYVSDAGNDSNDGSLNAPFATLAKAIEVLPDGGRIFLMSDYVVPIGGETLPAHTAQINISTSGDKELILEGTLTTGGPVSFIGANIASVESAGFISGSNKLEFGKNVNASGDPVINGANVTISSGTFGDVIGGATEDGAILDSGVSITVNGGTVNGNIVGGSTAQNATINGSVNITINGGTINGNVIAGDLEASSKITGLAGITITGGTFNGSLITAGEGTVGDKTSINYRDYAGSSDLASIIDAESFDLVTKPKAPKPVFSTPLDQIVVIEVIGDPTKALERGSGAGKAESAKNPNIEIPHANIMSTVNNSGAFTAKTVEVDGVAAVEYTPNVSVSKSMNIEGYDSMGKTISALTYKYVTMQIKLKTTATDTAFKPSLTVYPGGVQDNAYKNKTFTSETALVANEWTNVTFMIKPEDETAHMTRQFHYMPLGSGVTSSTLLSDDRVYISKIVISENPVTLSIPKAGGASQEEVSLNANDPVAINPSKLLKSKTANSFRAAVAQFNGKTVSQIKPLISNAPIEIDASAVFRDTGATPSGALDVNNHKYAVIKYYYETSKPSNNFGYEFELSGNRIWSVGNVLNASEVGGPPLETNKWATLVVELSAVQGDNRTSGFIFRPFGDEAASSFRGDKFYIESITFTTTQP